MRFFPGAASSGGCCRRRCSRSRPNACYACWPTLALAQPSEWVDRRFAARRLVYRLHGPHRSRGSVSPADSALGVFSRAAGGCALRTESSWLKFRPTDFQHTIRKFRVTVLFGFSDKSVGSGKRSRRPFALGLMRSSSVYEVPRMFRHMLSAVSLRRCCRIWVAAALPAATPLFASSLGNNVSRRSNLLRCGRRLLRRPAFMIERPTGNRARDALGSVFEIKMRT